MFLQCFFYVSSKRKNRKEMFLKENVRRQFKATLQEGARKGKVRERPKNADVQYNTRRTSKKRKKVIMEKI